MSQACGFSLLRTYPIGCSAHRSLGLSHTTQGDEMVQKLLLQLAAKLVFLLLLLLLLHSIRVPTNQQEIIMIYFFFKNSFIHLPQVFKEHLLFSVKIPTETLILPSAHPDLARTELVIYTPLSWTDLLPDVFLLPVKSLPPGHLSVRSPSLLGCKVCCRDP